MELLLNNISYPVQNGVLEDLFDLLFEQTEAMYDESGTLIHVGAKTLARYILQSLEKKGLGELARPSKDENPVFYLLEIVTALVGTASQFMSLEIKLSEDRRTVEHVGWRFDTERITQTFKNPDQLRAALADSGRDGNGQDVFPNQALVPVVR